MPKINLIKRSTITIDEFRSWLVQLIQDKKGALPDLNDWKLIKEQLDKVGKRSTDNDQTGYSILQNDDDEPGRCIGFEPYDMQFTLDLLERLCITDDFKYTTEDLNSYNDGLINQFYDEYVREVKPTEWEADGVLACAVRETYKEYQYGETKTDTTDDAPIYSS